MKTLIFIIILSITIPVWAQTSELPKEGAKRAGQYLDWGVIGLEWKDSIIWPSDVAKKMYEGLFKEYEDCKKGYWARAPEDRHKHMFCHEPDFFIDRDLPFFTFDNKKVEFGLQEDGTVRWQYVK